MSRNGSARGVAISLIGNALPPLVGLLTAPILALSLGVEGRGEVAAATAPLLLATSIATLGLPEAVTFFVARGHARVTNFVIKVALVLTAAGALGSALINLSAYSLASGDRSLASLIGLASVALVPALLLALLRGRAVGQEAWWFVTFERIINSLTRLGLVGVFAISGSLDVFTATISIAVSSFVGIVVYAFLRSTKRPAADTIYSSPTFRTVTSYSSRMWIGSLGGILLSRLDQSIMLPLAGARELGLYAVAATVSEMILVFNSSVNTVTFSTQSRENDLNRLSTAARLSTLVTLVSALVVAGLSFWALPFFFGPGFSDAIAPTLILLAAVVAGNPGSLAGTGLSARGRPGLRSASLLVAVFANLAAFLLLTPLLGAIGAALATLLGNVVAGWLNVVWLRHHFGGRISDFFGVRASDIVELRTLVTRLTERIRRS